MFDQPEPEGLLRARTARHPQNAFRGEGAMAALIGHFVPPIVVAECNH